MLILFSLQQVDTSIIGLSPQDAIKSPYIASMGVYAFKADVLLKLLRSSYPMSNDFGSEIIPSAVKEHNVQVRDETSFPGFTSYDQQFDILVFLHFHYS